MEMKVIYIEPICAEGKHNAARVFLEDGTEIPNITKLDLAMEGDKVSSITLKLDNVVIRNCKVS